MPTPDEIVESLRNARLLINAMAEYSADIAYARKRLYDEHLAVGFTEDQAFEYAKIVTLTV